MSRVLLFGGLTRTLIMFRMPMLRAMVAAGHEVIAAAPDEDEDVPKALKAIGVGWYPIDFERNRVQPFRDLLFVRRIRRMLRHCLVRSRVGSFSFARPSPSICFDCNP